MSSEDGTGTHGHGEGLGDGVNGRDGGTAAQESGAVCVIGLGYVGLTLAVTLAAQGRRVIGVERNQAVREQLARKEPHVREAGLDLAGAVDSGLFTVTDSVPAGREVDTYIVCVGTPVDGDGTPDLRQVEGATRAVADAAVDGNLVVLRSTVPVGTSRRLRAELRARADVELAFCPERTVQGIAVQEQRSLPQIVSAGSPRAVERASALFRVLTPGIVEVSDLETAEVAKLACNAYRYSVFAFANELARLCQSVGVSAREVRDAAGAGYDRAPMPFAGPVGGSCLPKDTAILSQAFLDHGAPGSALLSGVREAHRETPARVADELVERLAHSGDSGPPTVALLGVAFKGHPETDDERSSPAVEIVARLRRRYAELTVRSHDPAVPEQRQRALGYEPCAEAKEAVEGAGLVIIGTNHRAYAELSLEWLTERMAGPGIVYDAWALHAGAGAQLNGPVRYLAFGEGQLARQA
ncbi:nucleotide sugar dehydrogenase [Streptomyces luteocolor]|uniref:nucleotide sugar dehydrogenase n=1 Tax=Streptomyces luteocolor TaxID=285500 RepID=UPI001EDA2184|nr:nucleotide sugar dehydrogenase [Streptomyces luteocolor]